MTATDDCPQCDQRTCSGPARWTICDLDNGEPIVRWHACGFHIHLVLKDNAWASDCVQVYDLTEPVGRS